MDNLVNPTAPVEDPFAIDPNALPPVVPEDVDYLQELVGENKKFKDVQSLAKAKAESDRYIANLKRQLEDQAKELNTRASLEAFLTEIKSQKEKEDIVEARKDVDTPSTPAPVLDDSVIAAKVAEILNQRAQATEAQKNIDVVKSALNTKFGENSARVLHNKAQEAGLSVKELQEIAARSPQAFFRITGIDAAPGVTQAPAIPQSSVNVTSMSDGAVRGQKYYEKLKQSDPVKYKDPKTTSQMMKDMAALGRDRFYST